jgi:hypothetical protein
MATLDVTLAASMLKEYYSNQRVAKLTYDSHPFYAMVNKIKKFEGELYPLPMRITNPQGRSNTFSSAQGNKQPSRYRTFNLTRKKDYSIASIETEAILASASNPGAFLKLGTAEIDGALDSLGRSLSFACFGNGSGAIGTVASTTAAAAGQIALSDVEEIVKFEVGQTIEVRSGATVRVFSTGVTEGLVTGVDRDNGVITTDALIDGTTTIAANDTINVVGDYDAKLTGLQGWIPSSAPTSGDSFFGVDRSIDATRLAGVRIASSSKPLDEAFTDAARRIDREGLGSPDYGFINYAKYAALEKTLGSRVRYNEVEVAGIGFKGIEVNGPRGTFTIMSDRDCSTADAFLLDMSTWGLYSLGEPAMIVDIDGNRMLREATADAHEVRCASYSQLGCDAPGASGRMNF